MYHYFPLRQKRIAPDAYSVAKSLNPFSASFERVRVHADSRPAGLDAVLDARFLNATKHCCEELFGR
jgi:hypothetical protein